MISKSNAAFRLSCQHLFSMGKVYFWTFTFKEVWPDDWYPRFWHGFLIKLQRHHGTPIIGLRVIEPHERHGLHYHALILGRLSVHIVRRVAEKWGIGRVHVWRVPADEGVIVYLSKYLSKKNILAKGMHRWAKIGCWRHSLVSAVECKSIFHSNMVKVVRKQGQVKMQTANSIWRKSILFGRMKDWPIQKMVYRTAEGKEICPRQRKNFLSR